jgi:hypothetical protein
MIKLRRNRSEARRELQYVFEAFVIEELQRFRPVEELPCEEFIEIVRVARDRVREHELAGAPLSRTSMVGSARSPVVR